MISGIFVTLSRESKMRLSNTWSECNENQSSEPNTAIVSSIFVKSPLDRMSEGTQGPTTCKRQVGDGQGQCEWNLNDVARNMHASSN